MDGILTSIAEKILAEGDLAHVVLIGVIALLIWLGNKAFTRLLEQLSKAELDRREARQQETATYQRFLEWALKQRNGGSL